MIELTKSLVRRRDFLRGAASVFGGAVVGLPTAIANSRALSGSPLALSLAYWDGTRFIDAVSLASGSSLASVRLMLQASSGGGFRSIDSAAIPLRRSLWVSPPSGSRISQQILPVINGVLELNVVGFLPRQETQLRLTSSAPGAKLLEGDYILTSGLVNLSQYVLKPENNIAPVVHRLAPTQPALFPYVRLSVTSYLANY